MYIVGWKIHIIFIYVREMCVLFEGMCVLMLSCVNGVLSTVEGFGKLSISVRVN